MVRRRVKPWATVLTLIGVVLLDRITKIWVSSNLVPQTPWAIVPSVSKWFTITYIRNTGAAFGMLPDLGPLFAIVAVVVVVGLILQYDSLPVEHVLVRVAIGLIMGGAVGNLVDRLTTGYVVDFLDFKIWPIFNVADSSVVVGAAILVLHMLLWGEKPADHDQQAEAGCTEAPQPEHG